MRKSVLLIAALVGIFAVAKAQVPKGAESTASAPRTRIDPKPRIIELIGGKVMFFGVDAQGAGLWRDAEAAGSWRTPGVIHSVSRQFDKNLVEHVKAEPAEGGRPAKPAGLRVENDYITTDGKILRVGIIYREDGSVETALIVTGGDVMVPDNRTAVVPLYGGKSALFLLNASGQVPIFAGVYASNQILSSKTAAKHPGSEASPDGFQVTTWAFSANNTVLSFASVYKLDGTVDPAHAWESEGAGLKNRTQVVELVGGLSALLLADPKTETSLLKGIYKSDQLHQAPEGISLTERYLTLEGELLTLHTLYGPASPAKFVGARLDEKPIQNRTQMIKLAGNKSAVFIANPHATDGMPRFAGIQDTGHDTKP